MSKIRYAIIGSGWRSLFYIRIAKALPELFEVTGMLVRSQEKQRKMTEEWGIPVTLSREELLAAKPDFVVVAVSRKDNAAETIALMEMGVPVVAETPAADTVEELNRIWSLAQAGAKVLIAEQYFLYPTYEAKLRVAKEGYLGKVQNASLSALHDYHGISILRRALNAGLENVTITAKRYDWNIAVTQNRNGILQRGDMTTPSRVRAEFGFEGGTVGFYDFCGIQYHSHIRSRHFSIQGDRGELFDDKVYYLNKDNDPMHESLIPVSDGLHMGIESIAFAGHAFYRNPFPTNVLTEDETAIARLLVGMKAHIEGGGEAYPLSDALQDAYLTILLKKAAETGTAVQSETQIWAKS